MSEIKNFPDLMLAYTQLYEQKDLQQAHDVIQREMHRFPIQRAWILAWQFGLLAELGDNAGSIAMLRDALDTGCWYHEDVLKSSPDMATLQNIPEYQALVERSAQIRAKALAGVKPELSVIEPSGKPPFPLIIALHGDIGSIRQFEPYWQSALNHGYAVAFPQSSQTTWLSGGYVWQDLGKALSEMKAHFETLSQNSRLDMNRVILAGFSSGGQVAMQSIFENLIPARGFIGIEGWVFELDQIPTLLMGSKNPDARFYLVSGQQFADEATKVYTLLHDHNLRCHLEATADPNHRVPDSFAEVLLRALAFINGD